MIEEEFCSKCGEDVCEKTTKGISKHLCFRCLIATRIAESRTWDDIDGDKESPDENTQV